MIEIRPAVAEYERQAVFRFRYSVYVEEMRLDESFVDHDEKTIADDLDDPRALVLAAWLDDAVIGTARTNLYRDGVGGYAEYYRIHNTPAAELDASSVSTRLMIARAFRGTTLTARLAGECYKWALDEGVRTDYCDCEASVVPFFVGLGYRPCFDDFIHPELGPGSVMRLDLHDLEHLTAVRSPFRRILADWRSRRTSREPKHV